MSVSFNILTATSKRFLARHFRMFSGLAAVLLLIILPFSLWPEEPAARHIGLPVDWSTRHVIFTNGGSPEVVAAATRDPRSWIHWVQHSVVYFPRRWPPQPVIGPHRRISVDWAMPLGTGGGLAVGETPAKYSFDSGTNYSCANDFVVYTIAGTPGSSQANVIAFNNLYTGTASSSCPFGPQTPPTTDYTQPTVMWSYAAGTSPSYLSPTLSLDGKKIAFVENGTPALFDVLTPTAGQGTSATAPYVLKTAGSSLVRLSYTTSATSTSCNSSAGNSNASPYIDYTNDVAYIGADNGILYHITGVFNGTPTVDYCVTVKSNAKLTSPVYDSVSNQVFISDGYSVYAYIPGASSFTANGSIAVANTGASDPIVLSPTVDSTNGFIYIFSGSDSTKKYSIISQINTALTSQVTAEVGPITGSNYMLDGDFDNAYYTSGPKTGAGTLYACGTQTGTSSPNTKPSLYALSFSSPNGVMNSTPAMSNNTKINGSSNPVGVCSPLLDFYDGTNDRLFVGTGSYSSTNGANLVTEWNVNTRLTSTSSPNATATNEWGGTSGFAIDNISTTPQAASIYFGTLQPAASGTAPSCPKGQYCAIKLTQSALQ